MGSVGDVEMVGVRDGVMGLFGMHQQDITLKEGSEDLRVGPADRWEELIDPRPLRRCIWTLSGHRHVVNERGRNWQDLKWLY